MMSCSRQFRSVQLVCLLILLSSSIIYYIMMTSSGVLIRSQEYKSHIRPIPYSESDGVLEGGHIIGCNAEQQNTTCHNQTTLRNQTKTNKPTTSQNITESKSHHLIPKKGKNVIKNSLTTNLWNFEHTNDEQLFLYENLLKKVWSPNLTNIAALRQELAEYRIELKGDSQVLLQQQNIKKGAAIKFVLGPQVKRLTKDLFKRFPKTNPFPEGSRYKSCAVVGNGGILQNSSCGDKIDRHDYVFRCNLAPLAPFKQDAGKRSNFTTMNPSVAYRKYQGFKTSKGTKKYSQDISKYNGVIWMPCYAIFYSFHIIIKAFSAYKGNNPVVVCGNPKHFRSVTDFWVERQIKLHNNRLSTGFYLVTTAIQLCDEIHLYGFWPFSARYGDKTSSVPYHYFDDLKVDGAKSTHSMDKEFSLLLQLHNLGVLRLNVGSCS